MSGLLKFITCGSVDDGKSTLIGHILYDSKLLYADQEKALLLDSKVGSRGGKIDYSLLLDGLMAEREQGITIDVAYRYFTTDQRSFIVADTPGHEEYTRNMAVGASFAQLAVILVDATQGVLVQTRRHSRICALMGIRHFVFAVNKMDLAHYSRKRFEQVKNDIQKLAESLDLQDATVVPVSATEGDNVTKKSGNMTWYAGPALLEHLEKVDVDDEEAETGFYLPVQRVCRPNHEFRGFQGQIEAGTVRVGQTLTTLPSRETASVKSLLNGDREVSEASCGQAVTIQLDREVDVSRGCVLTDTPSLPVADSFLATLLWMDDEPLTVGKEYLVKLGTRKIPGVLRSIEYKTDINTGEQLCVDSLAKNEIALCGIGLSDKCVIDAFSSHRTLGELILIDRVSHMTAACGVVERVDEGGEKPAFEKDGLKVGGYIFEEFYFNLDSAMLSKSRTEKKTYHEGDMVPTEGESFRYPEYFDILSAEDGTAVRIRDSRVEEILPLDEYRFCGLPVADERGMALQIHSRADLDSFLEEYRNTPEGKRSEFHNKWYRFETWRRIVCTDNFWVI